MIVILCIIISGILSFIIGWKAHQRLSLDYKQRWLDQMKVVEDKSLFGNDNYEIESGTIHPDMKPAARAFKQGIDSVDKTPYVAGKWALVEKYDGTTAIYVAVRMGFDPVKLGQTPNYKRFGALYRRDKENAEAAVQDLNSRK